MKVRIAAQPIGWSNDDFRDLGGSIPLEQCLSEMREAGYAGTELGHKFPRQPSALKALLSQHRLALASGWHSCYLLSKSVEEEGKRFLEHARLLTEMGSRVAIVAECSGRVYERSGVPLRFDAQPLTQEQWERLASGLERLAKLGEGLGLQTAYHHHMGTVIQNEAELDRLMSMTRKLRLLADTGHMAFAGMDPVSVIGRHLDRVVHVHLKDVRPEVAERARARGYSFEQAVREGVFTVPGDGCIDYRPIFELLKKKDYEGWLVVEAEQDPAKANPLEYARKGREYLRKAIGC